MRVGIAMFLHISHQIVSCTIGLKSPIVPPNMANQDSITWDYINIILNNNIGALDQHILHLEVTNKILNKIYEFIGSDTKNSTHMAMKLRP